MRNFYLRKNGKSKKYKIEENKINNVLNTPINTLKRINVNKYSDYKSNISPSHSLTSIYTKDKQNNTKNRIVLKSNELTKILGKINREFYKNKNHCFTNISDCIQKDYLKSINNCKTNDNSSNNISRNYSYQSIYNKPQQISIYTDERKFNKNYYNYNGNYDNNRNNPYSNKILINENSPFSQNYNLISIYKRNKPYNQKCIKNKISNFILKNPKHINIDLYNDFEDEKDNIIISPKKLSKSHKKNINKSQNKIKRKISGISNNILSEKNNRDNASLSNPKNINNIGNFYNFWTDNDGHTGGKINLSLNNAYRNKIDYYSSLYYIVKIQSVWRGHNLRKALLRKNSKNQKLNIFIKQKLVLKSLFYVLSYKIKNNSFKIFKENIYDNDINYKQGYDINSSLLNNISNCYQSYYKTKNLPYNKKKLNEDNMNNLKLYNKNFEPDIEIGTPKIKKCKTKLVYHNDNVNNDNDNKIADKNNNDNINTNKHYTEYEILKTHTISYKSKPKNKKEDNNEQKEKENIKEKENKKIIALNKNKNYKKFIYIMPDEQINMNFLIDKKKNRKRKFNSKNSLVNPINNDNKKMNKYKEYIYFLFLLFARIQNASHRLIFKELINQLKQKAIINLNNVKKNKLLKIIKRNEKKNLKYYLKIYKEKIITERVKNVIFKRNNLFKINVDTNTNKKINNQFIYKSANKSYKNNDDTNNNRQKSKKYIRVKKLRSTSVNQSLHKNNSYYYPLFYSNSALSKSSLISPKKMIVKQRTSFIKPKKLGEYYELSPEYLLKKKMNDIFKKMDQKEMKVFFKRWKLKKNVKKKKKFLIYFIMLMKEYFCNDISLKTNKEYAVGKSMFFWYRKTFN